MCGIAGYLLRQQAASRASVQAMCDQIVHRGPDDDGYHLDSGCALGIRRLSIIDVNTGHQPIANEDQSIWVVFNGEIYNYQELRAGLEGQGHRFRTASDTEVLVHLWEQDGVEGLHQLRGMFAIALWDSRQGTLLLARDRFGKKPLYYAELPEGLYFGSELPCLRVAGVPLEIDEDALRLYFQFSYIPDPRTPYRAVRKLEPGTWLLAKRDGNVQRGRYWRLPVPVEHAAAGFTEEQAAGEIRRVFDQAVKLRMIADVPLGAFLSGGIDSSSVVASMAIQSRHPVKTFSIGFNDNQLNELPAAGLVASQYHTEHHEIVVEPDAVSLMERLGRHFGEPFGDSSAIPTFLVSEFAARFVKAALSGDGGDELFAGYESFFALDRLRRFDRVPQLLRALVSTVASALPYAAYGKNYLRMISRATPLERYFELNYTPYFLRQQLLEARWMLPSDEVFLRQTFPDALPDAGRHADILTEAIYFEATAKLAGDMLVKVDRMSMAASLEVRSPLLDAELADVAMRIPHRWKLKQGRGKQIFLKALGDRLPTKLLTLPKKGFGIPLADWFRGPLRDYLWDHLTSARFEQRGIVRQRFLRNLLDEHASQRRDNSHWLWMLLMLELWFRADEKKS